VISPFFFSSPLPSAVERDSDMCKYKTTELTLVSEQEIVLVGEHPFTAAFKRLTPTGRQRLWCFFSLQIQLKSTI